MNMLYSTISRMVRVKFPKLEAPHAMPLAKLNSLIDGAIIFMTKRDDVYKSNLLKGITNVMLTNQISSGNAWKNTMYTLKERFDRLVEAKVVWYAPYAPLHIVNADDIDVSKVKDPMFTEWINKEAKTMSNIQELPKEAPFEECPDCKGTGEELCGHESHHISTKTTCDRADCCLGLVPCETCGVKGTKAKEQFKIKSKRRIRVEFGEEGKGVVNTVRNKHIIIKSEE